MSEPFDQYVTILHQKVARSEHDKITPGELLWDQIVFGIEDGNVRECLLQEDNLDLKKTLMVCQASELSAAQMREVSKLGEMSFNAFETKMRPSSSETVSNRPKAVMIRDCNFCGRDHERSKTACRVWGKQCALQKDEPFQGAMC